MAALLPQTILVQVFRQRNIFAPLTTMPPTPMKRVILSKGSGLLLEVIEGGMMDVELRRLVVVEALT